MYERSVRRPRWWQFGLAASAGAIAVIALALQLWLGRPSVPAGPSAEAPLLEALGELTDWPPEVAARVQAVRSSLGQLGAVATATHAWANLPPDWRLAPAIAPPGLPPPRGALAAVRQEPCAACLTPDCARTATVTPRVTLALYAATATPALTQAIAQYTALPGQCAPAIAVASTTLTIVDLCANAPTCGGADDVRRRLLDRLTLSP